MQRFLIDVDTGIDDAVALLMALRAPDVSVAGVSVVAGNVPVDVGLENTRRVLDLAGAPPEVAVARGAERPLIEPLQTAEHVHGESGLGDYPLPPSWRPVDPRPAALWLRDTLLAEPAGAATLVALAPLTNLALALRLDPAIARRIKRLVVMGGSADGMGNATAAAEFNVAVDPEAAHIVFHSGLPITMVGLDPCRPTAVTVDRAADWRDHPSPCLRFVAGIMSHFGTRLGRSAVPLYDAVAMAVALEPDLAQTERLPLTVELAPGHHRGAVLVDRRPWRRHDPDWPRVDVVRAVDRARFERLLIDLLE